MQFELKQAEWKELRDEAVALSREARKLEQVAIGATGAVYAWLATHLNALGDVHDAAWFIPFLFSLAGLYRAWAIGKSIKVISDYMVKLESELSDASESWTHWEEYLSTRRGYLFGSAATFWSIFVLITLIVPILINRT